MLTATSHGGRQLLGLLAAGAGVWLALAPMPWAEASVEAVAAAGLPSAGMATDDAIDNNFGFWPAFLNSVSMIIVTELGDKTFFIAAVLAMRNDRFIIFSGAISALILMTVLSAAIGNVLPNLLPRKYTHYASALLFLYFGVKLLMEARHMEGSGPSDELQEVEEELIHKKEGAPSGELLEVDEKQIILEKAGPSSSAERMENGSKPSTPTNHQSAKQNTGYKVLTQAFTLTFLAEWGDRSQIATIALAAAKDPYGVTMGGVIGHALCTGLAVMGGRILAARISEKTVAVTGGILFVGFGIHSLIVGP